MKKIQGFILMIFAATFLFCGSAHAQRGYEDFANEENLRIMYRWQHASVFNRQSDAVLNLRVTNNNPSIVVWTYSVAFYKTGMKVYESETYELCLQEGQSRRGGLAGLRFTVEDLKMEDVEKETFDWDFSIFDVEEVEKCP